MASSGENGGKEDPFSPGKAWWLTDFDSGVASSWMPKPDADDEQLHERFKQLGLTDIKTFAPPPVHKDELTSPAVYVEADDASSTDGYQEWDIERIIKTLASRVPFPNRSRNPLRGQSF